MTTLVLGVCESHLWRSGVSRSISEPSLRAPVAERSVWACLLLIG
jgi:hypothetical protein